MLEIPVVHQISTFEIPEYKTINLKNGIPVVILQAPDPDVIRMDVVFDAGRYHEKYRSVAKTTAILLREGTKNMSSSEIAENLDYFGASLSTDASMDTSTIQIHCMGKYFNEVVGILNDIINNPIFPEKELEKFKSRILDKLNVELSKNEVLAYRHFTEKLFGENHPYGYNTMQNDYKGIKRKQLVDHFEYNYTSEKCKIFITGNVDKTKLDFLNSTLGKISSSDDKIKEKSYEIPEKELGVYKYETERVHQTAIRIGRRLFNRDHKDYPSIYLLNTIFGGYFGSRLSANIREDKGYTYGIYSSIDMMLRDGYFMISTDVGSQYLSKTLKEIYKEIKILQTELISEDELNLVKNYIKGNFLSLINGNLNSLNIIKTVELAGLRNSFYTDFIEEIMITDSQKLLDLANTYFKQEDLIEIQVGDTLKG